MGEYRGGAHATKDKVYTKGRFNDYVIEYKGIIRDAWYHFRKRVQSFVGCTNVPLDEAQENCMWAVDDNRLSMAVKTGLSINVDEEFLVA